jgi:hypothetical protein
MHIAGVEVVLLDIRSIFGAGEEILAAFLIIQNFYEELSVEFESPRHVRV